LVGRGAVTLGGRSWMTLTRRRMSQTLIVGEVAMAVVLLAGAGLLIRSFSRLLAVDPGFRTDRVLTMQVSVSQTRFPESSQVAALFDQLLDRVRVLPGVESAGVISTIFLSKTPNSAGFTIEGAPVVPLEQRIEATIDAVTPDFFRTLGVPLEDGRLFTAQDGAQSLPVVIINRTMARRFWPEGSAVGKRFKFGRPQSTAPWLTVAGVVGDMRRQGLQTGARSETFFALPQRPRRGMHLVVRTAGDPLGLAAAVRAEIRALDRDAPVSGVTTLERQIGQSVAQRRFEMMLLGLFAALALALAATGIYGLNYYYVVQRTQEIGVRMALGAGRGDVLRLVVGQGARPVAAGASVGLLAALGLTRLMESLLFGVRATDPVAFAAAAVAIALLGLAASWLPARRATKVDPAVALRYE